MAGFFGKYYLFTAAIEAGYTWLAIIGVLGSMVSVYYYIGVVVYMYFKEATAAPPTVDPTSVKRFPLVVSAVALIVLGIVPSMLESLLSSFWK